MCQILSEFHKNHSSCCSPTDKETIAKLREENEMLKGKVKELESSQVALEARVAALSTTGSSSTEEKDGKNTSESAQPSSEPAAPDAVETPDAPGTNTESKPAEPEGIIYRWTAPCKCR